MPGEDKQPVLAVAFELTPRCNADCLYCYNVWKAHGDYPTEELPGDGIFRVLRAILDSDRVTILSLTGGEPLLLGDRVLEMAAEARLAGKAVNLVTNGTLLNKGLARNLARLGVKPLEITLLSHREGVHNALQGRDTFARSRDAVRVAAGAGAEVVVGIVGVKANIPHLRETMEFARELGARGIMFTRFNPGGRGLAHWRELAPGKEEIRLAMKTLMAFSRDHPDMTVTCGVPMPPCVLGFTDYAGVKVGYCNAGGDLVAVDWRGNLRPCNHSSWVVGNILERPLDDLLASEKLRAFMAPVPRMCVGCQFYEICKGGCRAASLEFAWHLRQAKARFRSPGGQGSPDR